MWYLFRMWTSKDTELVANGGFRPSEKLFFFPNKIQGRPLNSQQRNRLSRENDPTQSWRAVFLEGEQLTSARLTFPIFSLRWAKIYLGALHGRGDSITATEEMVKAVGTGEEKWKSVSKQKLKKALICKFFFFFCHSSCSLDGDTRFYLICEPNLAFKSAIIYHGN